MNIFARNDGALLVETLAPSMTGFIRTFAAGEGVNVRLFGARQPKAVFKAVKETFSEFSPEGAQALRNPDLAAA